MSDSPARAFRLGRRRPARVHAERNELTVGVSGGPCSGYIYELLHDPAQTHERYFQQVREYLAEQKGGA